MERESKISAYQVYTTDALKLIAENTAKLTGGGYLKTRYAELLYPQPEETRTSEEIISHIKEMLGGE